MISLVVNAIVIKNFEYANNVLSILKFPIEEELNEEQWGILINYILELNDMSLLQKVLPYSKLSKSDYLSALYFLNHSMGNHLEAFKNYSDISHLHAQLYNDHKYGVARTHTSKNLENEANLFKYKTYGYDEEKYWNGQNISGKTLLVLTEAGYGDEIIYLNFIRPLLSICNVVVACSESIKDIVKRCFNVSISSYTTPVEHDYWIDIFSLPIRLNINKPDTSPYLISDKNITYQLPNDKPLIGMRWHGDTPRSIISPLSYLESSFVSFGNLVSLHKEVISDFPVETPKKMLEFEYKNWDDTLAMLDRCDFVITNETSVSVMSAALGKHTIVIAPKRPYMCWSNKPWFKNVHVFPQHKIGDWIGCIDDASNYVRYCIERKI